MPIRTSGRAGDVVCPFFRFEDNREQRVACEGIPDQATLITRWSRNEFRIRFMNQFCCRDYLHCPIAMAILAFKYAEED